MKLKDFKVGDRIRITEKRGFRVGANRVERVFSYDAEVTIINFKNRGQVNFCREMPFGRDSGSGSFDPQRVGASSRGIIKVEMV